MNGEERLLGWLARRLPGGGLGDDTATLPARGRVVATVDQQIEAVHFAAGTDPALLGRRLLAVNLSDLAASGARPRWALVTVAAPPGFAHRRFFSSLLAACARHGVALAGGDLATAPALHLSLTLVGERERGAASLHRAAGRAGQELWLGGPVGESALGRALLERGARLERGAVQLPARLDLPAALAGAARRAVRRHLLPRPQLELGLALARARRAGAAIDLSDGLAKDLHRLCEASGVGAALDLAAVRASAPTGFAALAAALGLDPDALQLGGGEDYVLLFTLPARATPPQLPGLRRVGTLDDSERVRLRLPDGRARALPHLGWDHLEPSTPRS